MNPSESDFAFSILYTNPFSPLMHWHDMHLKVSSDENNKGLKEIWVFHTHRH